MEMSAEVSPNLKPVGAGLPLVERWFAGVLLRAYARKYGDQQVLENFQSGAQKVIARFNSTEPADRETRILIPRFFGIEDSSRNWSTAMTLKHLALVNLGFLAILQGLANNTTPPPVDIGKVKPEPLGQLQALSDFNDSVARYVTGVGALLPFSSTGTHPHPWFGQFDSHTWHCLAANHLSIHRKQLALIESELLRKRNL